jgi:carboxyl-terminal processing protease
MEKAVRWSMVGLMVTLIIGLSFSLGFVLRMTLEDDGGPAATASAATTKEGDPDFGVLGEIYSALRDNYIEPERIDPELLRTGAINGLINAVGDTHQVYITKESRQAESRSLNGKYEGIGASVDLKGGEVIISRPFDGSPAKQAGIRIGDAILEVDGKSTKGWTTQQAVQNILGPRGSQVKLKVRHTDGKIEEITITRDEILLPSVHVDVPSNAEGVPQADLGYIRIDQFTGRTGEELKQALRDAKDKGLKGMILDLRNNPGGLVSSCVSVASQFLKSNDVVFIEQLRNGEEKNFKASSGGLALDIPMTVLVNHNSASCSEIIAGSLRDNRRAVVIGETTLGKGTVNQFFDLKRDGGALYVTIGRWLTPKRDQIEGRGVTPDISAAAADNEDPLGYFNAVMYRAVDYLRNGG